MLLGLRGTPVLYQGDEIGLRDVVLEHSDLRDPLGVRYWPAYPGRDAMRTPMPWTGAPDGGFTESGVTPWLPLGPTDRNVESQTDDPASMLTLTRDLIALRKATPDLVAGAYAPLEAPAGVWAWRRGARHAVVVNYSDAEAVLRHVDGTVRIATDRSRDGETFAGSLRVGAWEGVVVEIRDRARSARTAPGTT
jgi:alpha-glucosidase